jgi:extradiol dioxygenase family protein
MSATSTSPAASTATRSVAPKGAAPTPGSTSTSSATRSRFATTRTGRVDDVMVPMPHFGLVLELPDWQALADRLRAAGTEFLFAPQVRFEGRPGEQWTMFFLDPFGNPIEVKGLRSFETVYAKQPVVP